MDIADFLSPRLVGKRFDTHSIPLELLGDLAVLEGMIIEVAKWRYLRENPDRKRSPRKFTDGISLTLTAVEDGSAIARISLSLAVNSLFPTIQQDYLEQSRNAIVDAIAAASENRSPAEYLPVEALAYFDRLGRSLLDDEAIEFRTDRPDAPARLTRETRRRLLKAAKVTERTEEIHIRGGIFELNQEALSFMMMLPDGSKVAGPLGRQHIARFLEASNGYQQGVKVLLDGIGKFNRAERLERIESVEHVTLLDPLDFPSQIEELRTLKDGWLDGKGHAPPAEGLDWLGNAFNERYPDTLALPYVYPVAEGGVRFEWQFGRRDVSLEIDLRGRVGDWHSLDLDSDDEEIRSLNLNDHGDWNWMAEQLQALSGIDS